MGATTGEIRLRLAWEQYREHCAALGYDVDRWTLHEGSATADGSDPVRILGGTPDNRPPGTARLDGVGSSGMRPGDAATRLFLINTVLADLREHRSNGERGER